MSGRAYARNPSGALGGATDINSIVPHRFRVSAPAATSKAKALAIRRAIQRRCKEKNWKKLLRMRHTRLVPLVAPCAVENGAAKDHQPEATSADEEPTENGVKSETSEHTTTQPAVNGVQENGGDVTMEEAAPEEKVDAGETRKQQQQDALDKAKQELQEMEEKLATLSADKHAKFQLLKDLLIAEARVKVSAPSMPKKRRVDSLGSAVGTGSSPRSAGAAAGGGMEGAGLSLLGAPSPSLLRAQSFSVSSGVTPADFSSQSQASKDARRQ